MYICLPLHFLLLKMLVHLSYWIISETKFKIFTDKCNTDICTRGQTAILSHVPKQVL